MTLLLFLWLTLWPRPVAPVFHHPPVVACVSTVSAWACAIL